MGAESDEVGQQGGATNLQFHLPKKKKCEERSDEERFQRLWLVWDPRAEFKSRREGAPSLLESKAMPDLACWHYLEEPRPYAVVYALQRAISLHE